MARASPVISFAALMIFTNISCSASRHHAAAVQLSSRRTHLLETMASVSPACAEEMGEYWDAAKKLDPVIANELSCKPGEILLMFRADHADMIFDHTLIVILDSGWACCAHVEGQETDGFLSTRWNLKEKALRRLNILAKQINEPREYVSRGLGHGQIYQLSVWRGVGPARRECTISAIGDPDDPDSGSFCELMEFVAELEYAAPDEEVQKYLNCHVDKLAFNGADIQEVIDALHSVLPTPVLRPIISGISDDVWDIPGGYRGKFKGSTVREIWTLLLAQAGCTFRSRNHRIEIGTLEDMASRDRSSFEAAEGVGSKNSSSDVP